MTGQWRRTREIISDPYCMRRRRRRCVGVVTYKRRSQLITYVCVCRRSPTTSPDRPPRDGEAPRAIRAFQQLGSMRRTLAHTLLCYWAALACVRSRDERTLLSARGAP